MAARTRKIRHDDNTRLKIKTSQIINRMQNHFDGRLELSASQLKAGEILLRKVLPDLAQTENKTEVTTSYVARVPDKKPDMKAWKSDVAPALEPDKPSDPNKVN